MTECELDKTTDHNPPQSFVHREQNVKWFIPTFGPFTQNLGQSSEQQILYRSFAEILGFGSDPYLVDLFDNKQNRFRI